MESVMSQMQAMMSQMQTMMSQMYTFMTNVIPNLMSHMTNPLTVAQPPAAPMAPTPSVQQTAGPTFNAETFLRGMVTSPPGTHAPSPPPHALASLLGMPPQHNSL